MQKANGKLLKKIAAVALAVVIMAMPFLSVFFTGIFLPPQYGQTYYAELAKMYARLKGAQGKKVVVIGNSNVAFGVDSALMEELLCGAGLDYTVCNFGLYGSLGTKMMLDLSADCIGEGDIVIFSPEIAAQPLSLYFSAEEAWYALDADLSMYYAFPDEVRGTLAGAFFSYTSKKYLQYKSGSPAEASGVYALSSFDEHCDLKNYSRPYNIMPGGADANNPVNFDTSLFGDGFADYVNEYYLKIQKKGAEMYLTFPPVNEQAVSEASLAAANDFYSYAEEFFLFPVMSDISRCIMPSGWFYDSNFHLNEAGMTVRTVQLVNDIKNQLGNTTKTDVVLPEMPVAPQPGVEGEGDNSCADCFTYSLEGNSYTITGLTAQGAECTELVIPYQVDGLYVTAFLPSVFAGNTVIESVTVQQNISVLYDRSFEGCTSLEKLILLHEDPADISVGYSLTEGASFNIYVPEDALGSFKNNYFWGSYADILRA